MNSTERRALTGLASLYVFRMLGLFMVLPVLSVYGADYRGSTPALLGLALGAYGLSQALLQIPLGMLSDRWGRKPVIYGGLAVFAFGSLVAAQTDSVYGLIVGRVLQGCGAIAAATMALVADLTRTEKRGIAMAIIGAAIGVAFMLAVILGPLLAGLGGLSAIFWLTMALALFGMLLVWRLVPTPQAEVGSAVYRGGFRALLRSGEAWQLVSGVFFSHLLLTALFVALPLAVVAKLGLPADQHWKLYGPLMLGAFLVMLPLMRIAERSGRVPLAMGLALIGLAAGSASLLPFGSGLSLVAMLLVFFVAFNLLEALLPAQLTRTAPTEARGAATGLYATFQFLGAFFGGALGGYLFGLGGAGAVAGLGTAVLLLWALLWWLLRARGLEAGSAY
ncbi:Predicted arabinose efflux permease, MFS family [Microbulbifer donghaiensis]|uniref:Predicted arabinose efflux permease, MFS family n=1 Tax=Microbulbifer donghaiensis TaxID=494016 RepID=A0A1M5HTH0_9GAMM|nr:MFS transporter [Microbulbifer donghaiensis]SHG19256.1 Predicted arabinose efflux permease, MFS family [Microbulbifer donghaiensis]